MLTPQRSGKPAIMGGTAFSWIGCAVSLSIFVVAVFVLYHILRNINLHQLFAALKATDWRTLVVAGCFVAAGYVTLTLYDLFALRAIGRSEIPYRVAALGGFTSYAVGHNIGASVFSGGAVRYHIYSNCGLSVIDVTKICFLAGLTFWLGNVTVLGLGILYTPAAGQAIDQLPLWLNRGFALLLLALLAAYVSWVSARPRMIGRDDWRVSLPGGTLTLIQIAIGLVDLACCAAAMYMVMPDQPNLDFVTVAVIFVAATLLGFASHAPGGLGVFDAAMLVALWQFNKEDLLAGLLRFRLLYYIIPFVLSLIILGVRELMLDRAPRRMERTASQPMTGASEYAREQPDAS